MLFDIVHIGSIGLFVLVMGRLHRLESFLESKRLKWQHLSSLL